MGQNTLKLVSVNNLQQTAPKEQTDKELSLKHSQFSNSYTQQKVRITLCGTTNGTAGEYCLAALTGIATY